MRSRTYGGHPMVQFVRSLEGEFYLAREAAEQLGVSQSMLVYAARHSDKPLGPTHKASYGGTVLHLYTPKRIEQIRAYLAKTDYKPGPAAMWTKTEATARRRVQYRARDYRRRAVAARAAGNEKEAARLTKLHAALIVQLDRQKAARHAKVHGAKKTRAKRAL